MRQLLVLLVLLAACADDPGRVGEEWPDPASEVYAWPGGSVVVAPVPPSLPDTARFYADTIRLHVAGRQGSALTLHVPTHARGLVALRVGSATGRIVGRLRIAGVERYGVVPELGSQMTPVALPGEAAAVLAGSAGTSQNESLVLRFWPGSGRLDTLLGPRYDLSYTGIRAPGVTPDPTVLTFGRYGAITAERWRIHPQVEFLDTVRFIRVTRQSAILANGVRIETRAHSIDRHPSDNWVGSFQPPYESAQQIVLSPNGGLAVVTLSSSTHGTPVFDGPGDARYHVAGARSSAGAFFSAAGDTLFLAGDSIAAAHLFVLNASTGQELRRIALPGPPDALAADPDAPWIYVTIGSALLVVDRRTLAPAGRVEIVPPQCNSCWLRAIATGTDGVYVLGEGGTLNAFAKLARP